MFKVSVDELAGNRYKLRWREYREARDAAGRPVLGARGKPLRESAGSRSITVVGAKARDETIADIMGALRATGSWSAPVIEPVVRVANLEKAAVGWLEYKRTRCRETSVDRYRQHMAVWFRALRAVLELAADDPVPASALDREKFIRTVRNLQESGRSTATVYGIARSALDVWLWAADDATNWPAVPTPPRATKALLPRTPVYVAPPAPTIAEADACLRKISANAPGSRMMAIILRYTGIRISQVLSIQREDLDVEAATLRVRGGRSELERAEERVIPISRHLVVELRELAMRVPVGELLFVPSAALVERGAKGAKRRSETLATAWKRATKAGEAREVVWKPATRKKARPEHAFRAAAQQFWRNEKVDSAVIDWLVGHHASTTRDRHYAGVEDLAREAVDRLPPIDWTAKVSVDTGESRRRA